MPEPTANRYAIGPRADDASLEQVRAFAKIWRGNFPKTRLNLFELKPALTLADLEAVLERLEDIESELEFVRERATEH